MASYAILRGAANPEGAVTGDRGWLYVRTGASAGVYQKTSGDGTNTGWVALGGSSSSVADASTTTKGVTKVSVAPVSSTNPIAVGDNDPRVTIGASLSRAFLLMGA
jgi:hypothetical protein